MRQGSSIYDKDDNIKPDNLSFGRPPVLILRIGDFIHTKIIAKSLSINYTNGSNIQWDLNPEGIGVQPMMAEVSMSIEIIGGQSLQGPINRLQNAMSYNFYANTEMYDPRADSIRLNGEGGEIVDGIKLSEIRGDNLSDSLTKELKTELPIDQEATRLKAESNEEQAVKDRGLININGSNDSITILTLKDTTPTPPYELIDGSGENKLSVKIKNLNSGSEIINEEVEVEEYNVELSKLDKERYDNSSKIDTLLEEILDIEIKITEEKSDTNNKIKIKKLEKEKSKKDERKNQLISQNIIKVKVEASFTKDNNVRKVKDFNFKYDPTTGWVLQKKTT